MKTLLGLLAAGSVVLNLALFIALLVGRSNAPDSAATTVKPTSQEVGRSAPEIANDSWTNLQTTDLPQMVQRLREAGFPPELVRAIMAAQLRDLYAARIKALDPESESRPFWKNTLVDPRIQQAQSKLYREQQKVLRDLLGRDGDPNEQVVALYNGRRLDSVPPEKLDDVQRALREHEDARNEMFSSFGGGMITPDMQKKMAAMDKALVERLGQVLTPSELEAYNMRNSDTARQLRGNLSAFNPSEEEFRTIYKLQADFDERVGRVYGMMGPDESRKRGEAQRELDEQIKATLGPVRGAEYERASDHSFRQTSQLVARLELPPETTTKIWDMKQEVEQRANALRRDSSLTPEQRTKQLAALADESTARLAPMLGGQRGVDAFKQYGGFWLQNLTPRPPNTRPAGVRIGP